MLTQRFPLFWDGLSTWVTNRHLDGNDKARCDLASGFCFAATIRFLRYVCPEPGADYQVQRDSVDDVKQEPAQYAGQKDYQRERESEYHKEIMSEMSLGILPQRLAVYRAGESVHSHRGAEPDQRYFYL